MPQNQSELTQQTPRSDMERFQRLLAWLDDDEDRAAQKYEHIRRTLIKVFVSQRFQMAEDLTDEVIDRVMRKLDVLAGYKGDPSSYFHAVARNIMYEARRAEQRRVSIDSVELAYYPDYYLSKDLIVDQEARLKCFDKCLNSLSSKDRILIVDYYQGNRVQERLKLARDGKLTVNALYARIYRVKNHLKDCLRKCLGVPDS